MDKGEKVTLIFSIWDDLMESNLAALIFPLFLFYPQNNKKIK